MTASRLPRLPRRRLAILAIAAAATLTAGCGGGSGGSSTAPASGGRTITISNLEFMPDAVDAKVGDTITVVNKDAAEHTVTAVDNSFDTGRFAAGTKTFVVSKPGRIEYMCTVHPFMAHKFIQVSG